MPRIEVLQVFFFLWVAWEENDYHERGEKRVGFTSWQARQRVIKRLN